MRILIPLPIVLPLLAAPVSLLLRRRLVVQRLLGIGVMAGTLAAAVTLVLRVEDAGTTAVQLGGWSAPLGITLVADRLAVVLLAVSAATLLAVLVYAVGQRGTDENDPFFHPLYLVLAGGVAAAFLTGDIFNLFVAFEVMLIASYVLITSRSGGHRLRYTTTYVVIGLLASALFITAVAFLYAATGTVNLADLAGKAAALPDGLRTALGLLFLVVFGIKAAMFPLFFWLPDSYPTAPAPITAIFAGLLTKIGVYAIIRTQTLLFPGDGGPSAVILVLAGLTMLVGVLGAIAQSEVKRILSFHIISQIGYMLMGLGFFTVFGLAAAILFIVHQIVVKTTLFLVEGMMESLTGTSSLKRMGGLMHSAPVVAGLFLAAAFSLAGIPPFSGFAGKLGLVQAGLEIDRWWVVGASLLASLLTLFSMTKIWTGAFWSAEGTDETRARLGGRGRVDGLMVGATAALVAVSVGIAVFAQPLLEFTTRAAQELLEPAAYVTAVLG